MSHFPSGSRVRLWLANAALCLIALAAYANSFTGGLVLDNRALLVEDFRIRKATAENLGLILNHTYWWPHGEGGLYRPITTLTYLVNYAILGNGEHPAGYHLVNLLLHVGNVLLVFALCRRLTGKFQLSFLAAAIWVVHPALTESVTNIVGRADLLAGAATLAGFLIYLRGAEARGRPRLAWLAGLAVVTFIGVFSKESAIALIAVIALYEITWPDRRRWRGFLYACAAMAPALAALLWMRARVLAVSAPVEFPFVDNPIAGADFLTGRLTAIKVLADYMRVLVWPVRLSADYSYAQIPLATGTLADWIAWIAVAAAVAGAIVCSRRNRLVFFAAGFAFLTLLPASNLLIPIGTIMAERLLYLSAIGFAICLAMALYAGARRIEAAPAAALVPGLLIVAGLGARTFARNSDWHTDLTLWSAAVQVSPRSFKAHYALAESMRVDAHDLGGPSADAEIAEDEKSLAILDPLPDKWNAPGLYFSAASEYLARGYRLLARDPEGKLTPATGSSSRFERGRLLLVRGLAIGKAQTQTNGARKAESEAYLMLSETDEQLGKRQEGLESARAAHSLDPTRGRAYTRIHDALLAAGQPLDAHRALLEGYLLTSDRELRQKLVQDYARRPDDMKCAVSFAQAEPTVDFSCPLVRNEVCAISGDPLRLTAPGGAARFKRDIASKYACP